MSGPATGLSPGGRGRHGRRPGRVRGSKVLCLRKQESSTPLPWWERPAWPKARPGEEDFGGTRCLDSCFRRNDTWGLSIRLTCYLSLQPVRLPIPIFVWGGYNRSVGFLPGTIRPGGNGTMDRPLSAQAAGRGSIGVGSVRSGPAFLSKTERPFPLVGNVPPAKMKAGRRSPLASRSPTFI